MGPQGRQSARLSLQSSELAPPAPLPTSECVPPLRSKGGTHFFAGEGAVGANSDEGTDTLELQVKFLYDWAPWGHKCEQTLYTCMYPIYVYQGSLLPDPTFFHPGSELFSSRIRNKELKYFNTKKMVSKL
jgi:hypothetical protein